MDLLTARRLLTVLVASLTMTLPLQAQLISPGKLAGAHAGLEGIRQCTKCHALGSRGVSTDKCLACHTPLRTRIDEQRGLHATYDLEDCGTCHRDHAGREFHMVVLDTASFVHDSAGYVLREAHADLGCRDCHVGTLVTAPDVQAFKGKHGTLDATFLGLGTACGSCHETDDPHQGQFKSVPCDDCHAERTWDDVPSFDHDSAEYRLTGAHREVACADCHPSRALAGTEPTMVFTNLAYRRCNDCHRDPHEGAMAKACRRCHSTRAWSRINRSEFEDGFDHDATDFPLTGAHASATCSVCHTAGASPPEGLAFTYARGASGRRYPTPIVRDCQSCHLDYHESEFAVTTGGAVCSNCHGETSWTPTTFGPVRHTADTEFPLTGRHILVACGDCHTERGGRLSFAVEASTCVACHEPDDPHAGQFPDRDCTPCHSDRGFVPATVDHDATRFPLDGSHADVPCAACHRSEQVEGRSVQRFTPLGTACQDCHG